MKRKIGPGIYVTDAIGTIEMSDEQRADRLSRGLSAPPRPKVTKLPKSKPKVNKTKGAFTMKKRRRMPYPIFHSDPRLIAALDRMDATNSVYRCKTDGCRNDGLIAHDGYCAECAEAMAAMTAVVTEGA